MRNAVVSLTTEERHFISSWLAAEKAAATEHLDVVKGLGDRDYLAPVVSKLQMIVGLSEKVDMAYLQTLLGGDE